jgi:leader peptidase (prepilin peptidase)/N-methyltransferase
VISWLVLRGKCRHCGNRISLQYPLIELLTGGLWVAAYLRYGLTIHAFAGALFCTTLLGILVTDARHQIIPDEFSLGGLVLGLLLSAFGGKESHFQALLGAEVGFGLLWVVGWLAELAFKEEAMGGGDVKMLAMVGAFIGWKGVLLTIFLGALLGTLVFGPVSLARRQARLKLPFGVFLAIAAALGFFYMDTFVRWFAAWLAWQA